MSDLDTRYIAAVQRWRDENRSPLQETFDAAVIEAMPADPWAGARRAVERHMADPCRYQPPESFARLPADERELILSGWGGVPWTEVSQEDETR